MFSKVISIWAILAFYVTLVMTEEYSESMIYIYGTWVSASNSVLHGPQFFDPINDTFQSVALPGISMSFTEDGFFEHAAYEIVGSKLPGGFDRCAERRFIYQHGTYEILTNDTLILNPWVEDGRIEVVKPCQDGEIDKEDIEYYYFDENLVFHYLTIDFDNMSNRHQLNLVKDVSSGTIENEEKFPPLYLAFNPPMMLPTEKLRPDAVPDLKEEVKEIPKMKDVEENSRPQDPQEASQNFIVKSFLNSWGQMILNSIKKLVFANSAEVNFGLLGATLLFFGTAGSLFQLFL
ncbi:hypothetical protein NADFUDRAFT_84405 [Nadsonia fulvescens var. elongata DSM 6958]|uniref:Protein ROT1 n=1 Tax=Nadsonia fulvescens var. elongata DSM 6958 TaxID=857566 RepID=A0A1E3PCV5_9ASCO|nr:hypothetical protein NADFUDRAFT_84405 [Nadsonia fulvescens var. elongata DSM 6958]